MFIGHFAVAYLLAGLFPVVSPLVILLGVSFPDLLWPVLVLAGKEQVTISPDNPLQSAIVFTSYRFSHSLVTGILIATVPGLAIGYLAGPGAGAVFVAASATHWLLDAVTHVRDLPVLGAGRDIKAGLGLWKYPKAAFVLELIFYTIVTALAVEPARVIPLLALGFVFHLINANSFFGFTRKNPLGTPRIYASAAIVGFLAFIGGADWILTNL